MLGMPPVERATDLCSLPQTQTSRSAYDCPLLMASTPHTPPHVPSQNAYTSADETCYQLVVPCEGPDAGRALLKDALDVLAQFAFHIRWAPRLCFGDPGHKVGGSFKLLLPDGPHS